MAIETTSNAPGAVKSEDTRHEQQVLTGRVTTTMVFSIFALVTRPVRTCCSWRVSSDFTAAGALLVVSIAIFLYAFFAAADCDAGDNSCARRCVFTRARSFFASRRRLSASACPVVN